jgi:hypothetical protein
MKLWEKNAVMPSILNKLLKHRFLVDKVILLAKKPSHTAIFAFKWTNRGTFCTKLADVKAMLLKDSFEAFWLLRIGYHLLRLTTKSCYRI